MLRDSTSAAGTRMPRPWSPSATLAGGRQRRAAPAHPARGGQSPGGPRRPGRESPRAARRLHVFEPRGHVRRPGRGAAHLRCFGHRLHQQHLRQRTPLLRRSARRGIRHQPQLRTAGLHAARPRPALRRDGRKYRRHGQAPRTGHSLYIYRGLYGRVASGQGRMADGGRRTVQRPRQGCRDFPRNRRTLQRAQEPNRQSSPEPPPESHAQHALPRHLVHALVAEFHGAPDRRRRRRIRLHKNASDTSVAVDLEEAYLLASSADTWINVGPCNTLAELTAQNPKFADVPAVSNRQVFNNNRRQTPAGGSDFWESGVIRPDLVLRDLCTVFNPQAADTAELYYYKRLE